MSIIEKIAEFTGLNEIVVMISLVQIFAQLKKFLDSFLGSVKGSV